MVAEADYTLWIECSLSMSFSPMMILRHLAIGDTGHENGVFFYHILSLVASVCNVHTQFAVTKITKFSNNALFQRFVQQSLQSIDL